MYKVRAASPRDYRSIEYLLIKVFKTFLVGSPDEQKRTRRLRNVQAHSRMAKIYVVTHNDQIVGVGSVELSDNPTFPEFPKTYGHIRQLAVDQDHRQKGVGTLLIQKISEVSKAHGKTVLAVKTEDSMVAAQKAYEAAGFVRAPELDYQYPTRSLFAYLLNL